MVETGDKTAMAPSEADTQWHFQDVALERFTQRWHSDLLPSLEDRLLDSLTRTLRDELKEALSDLQSSCTTSRCQNCAAPVRSVSHTPKCHTPKDM